MEFRYEFDSLTELPPLPQEFDSRSYFSSAIVTTPLDSLPPFPPSDFTPFSVNNKDGDDSFLLDSVSPLSLLTESTQLQNLFPIDVASTPFLHMPSLISMEQSTPMETTMNPFPCLSLSPPSDKTRRVNPHKKLGFIVSPSSASSSSNSGSPAQHGYEKQRRISDKIRSLEKLMPCVKKMDMATVLEEAHKYIRFLHSQIAALRWMPLESVYSTAGKVGETDPLRSLTRQQILQVIANSPGARTELYTRGVCVFSYEQLLSLKMMAPFTRNL